MTSNRASTRSVALDHFAEPRLSFAHSRALEDPKSGLFIYGPPDLSSRHGAIRLGLIGTQAGIFIANQWIARMAGHIPASRSDTAQYLPFPGFEAVFGMDWSANGSIEIALDHAEILNALRNSDRYQRVYSVVGLYEEKIRNTVVEEDQIVDVWLAIVPDDLFRLCRPRSTVPSANAIPATFNVTKAMSRRFLGPQQALFSEDVDQAQIYRFHPDFHNQLKARLLADRAIVQIVRESTLVPQAIHQPRRRQDDAMVAWNLSTALYYKSGGKPWHLANVRSGVCYIGLVFKRDETEEDARNICCGAQLFMSDGDGVVFKVAKGNFQSGSKDEYHLPAHSAKAMIELALRAFRDRMGADPTEIFVHGRTRFRREEYEGFKLGCSPSTKVTCVRIQPTTAIKLFTRREMPVLRGTAYIEDDRNAFLWTKGFIPQIGTYPGREVPNPLSVSVVHGDAPIRIVLQDVLALTKVNYNSCVYADGLPVTMRFANAVGEILTSAPIPDGQPLPFRHYI